MNTPQPPYLKTPDLECARYYAALWKVAYGLCVTDGQYYVGPLDELDGLPVVVKFDFGKEA